MFETEVVSMSADLVYGDADVVGNMTSGGTESIICAVKAAKTYAAKFKDIKKPEMVVPMSVHPAFDKAANYFGIKLIHVPVRESDMRCDVQAMEKQITKMGKKCQLTLLTPRKWRKSSPTINSSHNEAMAICDFGRYSLG